MFYKSIITAAMASTMLAVATMPASAATHMLNLTGNIANSSFNTFTSGMSQFQTWELNLDGFQPFNINVGDNVQLSVALNGVFVVPQSGETFVGFNLKNGSTNPTNASNNGTWTFLNSMGPTGLPSDTLGSNCSNCLSSIVFLGAQPSFSFNGISANFTIDTLDDVDFLIDGASLSYQLRDSLTAVPEPATWAMMIAGFGLVGGAMRRRAKVQVTYA